MRNDLWKDMALGAAGGAVGVLAMTLYWKTATAIRGDDPRSLSHEKPDALDDIAIAGQQHEEGEPSTAAAGRLVHEAVTGEEPDEERKRKLSNAVHWGYGVAMGTAYALLRRRSGAPDAEGGLALGAMLWAVGDELAVPLLGLSRGPTAYPMAQHAHRLGAHLAYGLAVSSATQVFYSLTDSRPSKRDVAMKVAKTYLQWKAIKGIGEAVAGAVQKAA
jgi:hypothetical protein